MKASLEELNIWEMEFPFHLDAEAQLRFLLGYAILAPSTHNTQPWLWSLAGDQVELYADRSRAMPVADPDDRELMMSCGATLQYLRIAMRHFGYSGHCEMFPVAQLTDLLARVHLGKRLPSTAEEDVLFWAMRRRHTQRQPFEDRGVPEKLLVTLRDEALSEGAWLHVIKQTDHDVVADLIEKGDLMLMRNDGYRREMAAWMHADGSSRRDGVPASALGMSPVVSHFAPFAAKSLYLSSHQAVVDRELAQSAPVLVVLGTDDDSPTARVAAGQALARVLLQTQAAGVAASFFNQPIQEPSLRPQLHQFLGLSGCPQLLFRLGYSSPTLPTPRRLVDEVLAHSAQSSTA